MNPFHGIGGQLRRTLATLVIGGLIGCTGAAPAPTPPPKTNAELVQACWGDGIDYAACAEVAPRLLAEGDVEQGLRAMDVACAGRSSVCIDLGLIHYEGVLVPKSIDKARDAFGSGCLKRDGKEGCAYEALLLLEIGRDARHIETPMDLSCRFGERVGWPCYNLGVGLACGLFGPPQRENALGALQKGCRLGDDRACKLHLEYGEGRAEPVCTQIGPDPARPLAMDLELGPNGQLPATPDDERAKEETEPEP